MAQRRKSKYTTLCVTRAQHTLYRQLVELTGLQPGVLMDRLLRFGQENPDVLLRAEGNNGVPASVPA